MSKHLRRVWKSVWIAVVGLACSAPIVNSVSVVHAQDSNKAIADTLAALKADLAALRADVAAMKTDLAAKADLEALQETVISFSRKLDQISTTTPDGRTYPKILGNMQASQDFQREIGTAVQNSLQTSGRVIVKNDTATPQQVTINGVSYWVNPGIPLELTVPTGTLVAHLSYFESPKHWTIAPPTYTQVIAIR